MRDTSAPTLYSSGGRFHSVDAERYEHAISTTATLTALVFVFLVIAWQLVRLPLGYSGLALAGLALITSGYLAFRLWLTSQSMLVDGSGFELRQGAGVQRVEFDEVRSLRFDRLSHDLLVETEDGTMRIARTLQGHRMIRKALQGACPGAYLGDASPDGAVEFRPRPLPRVAAVVALFIMAMCVSAVWLLNPALGFVNLVGLVLPTYVLCDRVVLARCRISADGLTHTGIRGARFHARGELEGAQITKGVLSSTLRLDFANRRIEIHEYLIGHSLVEISESLETQWGIQVQPSLRSSGLYPGVGTELT